MPRNERSTRADLEARVEGLGQVRGRLLSNQKAFGRARVDAERDLARADAVADRDRAARAREILHGLRENERRVGAAIEENKRALHDAQSQLHQHIRATAAVRAQESKAHAIQLTRARDAEIGSLLKRDVAPLAREVIAAVNAAVEDDRQHAHVEGRATRVHSPILDALSTEVPGGLGRIRALLAIIDNEVLALPMPTDGYTARPQSEALRRLNNSR